MVDRWSHWEAGTEVPKPGSGPVNELNPMGCYRADTEVPFRSLSATVGGREKRDRLPQTTRSNSRWGGGRAAAMEGRNGR